VYDVIATSSAAIAVVAPRSVEDVRSATPLIRFSDGMRHDSSVLKRFLFQNLYRHPQVMQTTGQAKQVISDLFGAYMDAPHELPAAFTARARSGLDLDSNKLARVVADYIAGMTDRFASREHERLTGQRLLA
jgi:dGTPase